MCVLLAYMDADMTIRDVMSREFVGVSESDPVDETVRLMLEEEADCAVVLRGDDPVGMITDRDVLSMVLDGGDVESATVAEAMNETLSSVRSDRDLAVAIDRLSAANVSRLVVLENGSREPVGLLTHRDVTTAMTHSLRPRGRPYDTDDALDAGGSGFEMTDTDGTADDTMQSICESCGTLSRSLSNVDGQLLCPDCRDV